MKAKTIKKINVGSCAFFNKYDDFQPHDNDMLYIIDQPVFGKQTMLIRKDNIDRFLLCINEKTTKEDLMNEGTKDYYQACKFLIPEFIEYIKDKNFTIEDLKQIRHFFNNVKPKHLYTQYICDAYISNNDFVITDEQLNEAYKIYKDNKENK